MKILIPLDSLAGVIEDLKKCKQESDPVRRNQLIHSALTVLEHIQALQKTNLDSMEVFLSSISVHKEGIEANINMIDQHIKALKGGTE